MEDKAHFRETYFSVVSLLLFVWLSFFAGPLQGRYQLIANLLFVFLFFLFILQRRVPNSSVSIFNGIEFAIFFYWLVLAGNVLFAKEQNIALSFYLRYGLPLPFIYYWFKLGPSFVFFKARSIALICLMTVLVATMGIFEFLFRTNIIYECLTPNIFYPYYLSQRRVMSTQLVPQVFGCYLASSSVFCWHLFFQKKSSKFRKICAVIFLSLVTIGSLLSFQRVVLTGLTASGILFLYLTKRRKAALIYILSLLILILFFSQAEDSGFKRISLKGFIGRQNYSYRIDRARISAKIFGDACLAGVGLGRYPLVFDRYSPYKEEAALKTPENMYLRILCEVGLLGAVPFLVFLWLLLRKTITFILRGRHDSEIAITLFSALVPILMAMLTYDALYWAVPFYLFWAYCGMLAHIVLNPNAEKTA